MLVRCRWDLFKPFHFEMLEGGQVELCEMCKALIRIRE